jgi:RNA polymerase sigma-70 factor (ECF subfamily)
VIAESEITKEAEIIIQSVTDPESFRPLYEKYFKKIFLFLFHRLGERELAADITQQVFLKALTGLSKFQDRGLPFSAWLYRIAINECNEYFRKNKKARIVTLNEENVIHLFEEITSDQTVEKLHEKLPSILEKLMPDELNLVELRYFENKAFAEIGVITGITENHAKVKVYRILEKMKKLFLL